VIAATTKMNMIAAAMCTAALAKSMISAACTVPAVSPLL
jgi:hypothetical protein